MKHNFRWFLFYLIQSAWGMFGIDSNKTLNPGNGLLITWVNMGYQIKNWYHSSTHFLDSGLW